MIPAPLRTLLLSLCLLIAAVPFSSAEKQSLATQAGRTAPILDGGFFASFVNVDPDKSWQDDASAKQKAPDPPDSYVGAVVGVLFAIGVGLSLTKLQRRRPRKNMYYYGRRSVRDRERRAA
jgi:hypothetical protein